MDGRPAADARRHMPEGANAGVGHDATERGVVELGGGVHVELAGEMDLLLHARQRELHMLAPEQAPGGAVLPQPAQQRS